MANMGKYCKAYPVSRLRQFNGWSENASNTRKEARQIDGKEVETNRVLGEDDYLYLQENFVVTDGIFIDENVIFDAVTPEWIDYCKSTLKFEVPSYEAASANASQSNQADEG